jgi:hypothetical protein
MSASGTAIDSLMPTSAFYIYIDPKIMLINNHFFTDDYTPLRMFIVELQCI